MNSFQLVLNRIVSQAQSELLEAISVVKSKGFKYFQRVWLGCFLILLVAYKGIYQTFKAREIQLNNEIETARLIARYAAPYKSAALSIAFIQRRFPPEKISQTYLTDTVMSSLKKEGLFPDSISSPQESQWMSIKREKIKIDFVAQFPQLVSWLENLSQSPYLAHVSSLSISKKGLDSNHIHCEISTLINSGGLK